MGAGHGRLIVRHRERSDQGDVAGVGQLVAVADRLIGRIVGRRAGSLDQRRAGFCSAVTVSSSELESTGVPPKEACPCAVFLTERAVQIGLRDRVAGRAGQGGVGSQAGHGRAGDGRFVVGDRERPREGHIAGVFQLIAVGDRLAGCGVGRRTGALDNASAGDRVAGTVTVSVGEVVVPSVALATLVSEPASRSDCWIV